MPFLSGTDRNQMMLPYSLDMMIAPDNPVRLIDAFTHAIDMKQLGFTKTEAAAEGRPAYEGRDLLGLYIYGNMNKVRSSRCLNKECRRNIEVKWLMRELEPDFRTISDFRKNNPDALKKAFLEFNRMVRGEAQPEFYSIDGSKFAACNAKDRNFTLGKLDDRIDRLEIQIEEYMRLLDENDAEEDCADERELSREELLAKIEECGKRKARYEEYLNKMEQEGLTQLSITDTDARLMKTKNTYGVSHNVQTAVDSETHMVSDFYVTSNATDHGMLAPTMQTIKEGNPDRIIEVTADKGYDSKEDMMECLENGIIPSVIMPEGEDFYELETEYEQADITEAERRSTNAKDIKKCLRAGVIPEAYEDVLSDIGVAEVTETIRDIAADGTQMTEGEYKELSAKGYFVRDIDRDMVYCPSGRILRKKSTTKSGVRYCNKLACRRCPDKERCTGSDFRVVEMREGQRIAVCQKWNGSKDTEKPGITNGDVKTTKTRKKVVRVRLKPDRRKMDERKCLSEHPFGTVKRTLCGGYFLLTGRKKVTGELALSFMAYNIRRALNAFGFEEVMRRVAAATA